MKPIIFVFGSNEAGLHGAGAARDALQNYGAMWTVGKGLRGQSYAIPTKDADFQPLTIEAIGRHVYDFLLFAEDREDLNFFVTPIGCGLAGFRARQIAPLFRRAGDNVSLPLSFIRVLNDLALAEERRTMSVGDIIETMELDDIHDLLESWDPEWMFHYNWDTGLAISTALQYGMPEFEKLVREFAE